MCAQDFHFFGKNELFGLYPAYYNMDVYFNISIRERPPPTPFRRRCGENVLKELTHSALLKTFSLPTDAHNVKEHRVIKTF